MTGDAACKGIRERDPDGSIGLVSIEAHPPYKRPPLTKSLWKNASEDSIWRGTAERDVDLHLGRRIVSLDVDARRAVDDTGEEYRYERLLLATGGRPRRLSFGGDDVVYFRTLDDYRFLRRRADDGASFAVIGGGFIGSEIAAALAMNDCRVTMLFPENGIGTRIFPKELAAFVTDYYREKGVEVVAGARVSGIEGNGATRITTGDGREVEADVIVAGLGIEPVTDLAEAAGLPVENGIVVDEHGRVGGRDDVYAAGDVAVFPAVALGKPMRIEHEDHANTHGAHVGANMAGAGEPYEHLPFFYSDLFDLGYEAVGEVDPRLETVEEWKEPNRAGVVCYTDGEGRARGFLLWDVWGRVDAASSLIRSGRPIDAGDLRELMG
jgi:3-phenylpropionate/trans-cinnamate dioxygenase ferredoxin reductase component